MDLYGGMPDYGMLSAVAYEYGLNLIEDAAEAIGSEYNGLRRVLGDVAALASMVPRLFLLAKGVCW